MMSFNDFINKYNLKNTASKTKIHHILSSLTDVGIFFKNGPFKSDIGIVTLHLSKGTHWAAYMNESFFDSYGWAPPQKLFKVIIKQNEHWLSSEYTRYKV